MKIPRHEIDLEYCEELLPEFREQVADRVAELGGSPDNLDMFTRDHLNAARFASVADPNSDDILRYVETAAQAIATLFAVNRAGEAEVQTRIGEHEVSYTGPVDESLSDVGNWINGFHLAVISRNPALLDSLCETSTDQLRESSTQFPAYYYHYADVLRGYWLEDPATGSYIGEAIDATDPERSDIGDVEWTLSIDVPVIEVTMYCLTSDDDFGKALVEAVELHRRFWSKDEEWEPDMPRSDEPLGYVSFGLTAMAVLASQRGLPFDVESEYLPDSLVQGIAKSGYRFRSAQ